MSKFERIRYPDGQVGAKYLGDSPRSTFGMVPRLQAFLIEERINSYEDLFYVRAIADILSTKGISGSSYKLFIPCLFGQRSDRRFSEMQSFDLKLITDVINDCNFGCVEILDPHSDVAMALIRNSEKRTSYEFVKKAVRDIQKKFDTTDSFADILLVSPDAGAYKKVYEYGEKLQLPTMGAMKCRVDGIPAMTFTHDVEGKDCLIVDDLCDGGATFVSLAKLLKLHKAKHVYLYVTHGLFSKGFDEMMAAGIDRIYCTNSHHDITTFADPIYVTQYKVI